MKPYLLLACLVCIGILVIVGGFTRVYSQSPDHTQTAIAATIHALNTTQTAIVNQTLTPMPTVSANKLSLRVFVRGADGLLYQKILQNQEWTNWVSLPVPSVGITTDSPSAVTSPDGRVDLFVRGKDNALWHEIFWPDGTRSEWESLGGNLTSGPAAVGGVIPGK